MWKPKQIIWTSFFSMFLISCSVHNNFELEPFKPIPKCSDSITCKIEGLTLMEVERPNPSHSVMASGVDGYALMGFTLTDDLIPNNIRVIDSYPTDFYDKESTRSIETMVFKRESDDMEIDHSKEYKFLFRYISFKPNTHHYTFGRIPDHYLSIPSEAIRKGLHGKVELSYYLSNNGMPVDIQVVSSTDEIFEKPAIEYLSSWRHRLSDENIKKLADSRLRKLIDFSSPIHDDNGLRSTTHDKRLLEGAGFMRVMQEGETKN